MKAINTKDEFPYAEKISDVLYTEGNIKCKSNKKITIVGTRRPTEYGINSLKKIISGLSGFPITIISGLAIGIDSLVHEQALLNNIHTIAIPGSSLQNENIYPRKNISLLNKILNNNGGAISLWKNQTATTWTFPARNAVMAAISDLVVIIEAKELSGTMITANEAIKRNILLAAIPGNIDNIYSMGPNSLIKNGAKIITCSDDILELLKINKNEKIIQDENDIIKIINQNEYNRDNLSKKLNLSISELNIELTMLEIEGLIYVDSNDIIRAIK